ncbi:hypothetical protein ABIE26_000685 [Pedobacter africanus]|uniref:Uncharacterized protein n=1 Tax=Pedobacter africanus TaxID=151894 RepID=A0ACC6KUM5_9SPHI|nr:hypothetical protein [Pedobacter africanus]MDR6782828.1 hypothetical protein [Pedobacter africanus]
MKRIIFAALVAVVAVGSAFAQKPFRSTPTGGTTFDCLANPSPLCSSLGTIYYNIGDLEGQAVPSQDAAYNLNIVP